MQGIALQAVLFGLVATLSWGVSDYFGARISKKLGGFHSAALICVFAAIAYDLANLLFMRSEARFTNTAMLYAVAAGFAFTFAMASFYKGLELGPVSIVSPLGSLYPLVTTLLLVLLFGNHLSERQIIGICIVAAGVIAASGLFDQIKSGKRLSLGPLFGLLAALFWGINFALIAQSIHKIGWQSTTLVQQSCSAIVFLILLLFLSRNGYSLLPKLRNTKHIYLIGAAVLQIVGFLSLTIGIGKVGQLASIAVAVSACYPVITVFLALKNLGEKFDAIPIIGALVSVAGIVILSLG